jgi:hypothetical protein
MIPVEQSPGMFAVLVHLPPGYITVVLVVCCGTPTIHASIAPSCALLLAPAVGSGDASPITASAGTYLLELCDKRLQVSSV